MESEREVMRKNEIMQWTRTVILCLGSIAFLAGCQSREEQPEWRVSSEEPDAFEEETLSGRETLPDEETQALCFVHVCGAVALPDVYELPEGSHIVDAIRAAGGFLEQASQTALNLALPVSDGMQIYVPTVEEAETSSEWADSGGAAAASDGRVNINKADAAELCTLPGIGESRAADIIAYREKHGGFSDISEIMNVSGIKDASYEKIKDLITVK